MANQLRAGVLLSYLNMAIGTVIPFLYTPIMLQILGQSEYGLYSLSSSVVSYLSLLSFGFGSTITRYLAKYRFENNDAMLRRTFGFFLLLYLGLALLVALAGFEIICNLDIIFSEGLSGSERDRMVYLVAIMTATAAISFPASVLSSVVAAFERFVFRQILNICTTVAAPILNLVALFLGYSSTGLAVAGLAIQIAVIPFYAYYCVKRLHLIPSLGLISRSLFREMLLVSFFNFLGGIVDMLFWSTDKVILGMLVSSSAVAVYNIGSVFNSMLISISSAISGVLAPRITGMVALAAPRKELTALFIKVGRLQFLVVALVVSGFVVFGKYFVCLWAGNDYSDAYYVALLTIIPLSVPLIQNTGLAILVAQNKQGFRSISYLVIAIINVVSTWLVVPLWGIIGAAICSALSYIAGQGVLMNVYYHKVTGLDIGMFWRNIGKMSIFPIALLCCWMFVVSNIAPVNWFILFVEIVIYSITYALGSWLFSMNSYEKGIFISLRERMLGRS